MKDKSAFPMIALATITLILSSYGLFELMHKYADAPWILSIVAVAGFDLFAMAAGRQALIVAQDGDSAAPWMLFLILAAGLSAVLQYAHNGLEHRPWAVGVMFAMFPIATVVLFEGTLRRAHRLQGRRTRRIAAPRATFEILQWLFFPKVTLRAMQMGILDRSLSGDGAFKLAMIERQAAESAERDYTESERRTVELDYDGLLSGRGQITAGGSSGPSAESAGPAPDPRTVAAIVRELAAQDGADKESVVAEVLRIKPDANEDTVRRTYGKVAGQSGSSPLRSVE